ncbi:MAG TPA: hypothetical protein VNY05_43900 [Candidatus Acidoferrales bacterium]|jgi:hypothetical protein|nr:hypothetical protein [Candidatus Acidoferrales bacterium]
MRKTLLLTTIILLAVALAAVAADVSGKWVAQVAGRNGTQEVTFNLKADGGTLTGTVTGGMGGRGGGGDAPQPVAISDGKIDGANVSFAVKVEANGQTRVTTYSGTLSGDELKLKQTRQGRNGEQTADVTAKRATT